MNKRMDKWIKEVIKEWTNKGPNEKRLEEKEMLRKRKWLSSKVEFDWIGLDVLLNLIIFFILYYFKI